jgi:hypothetical protein
MSGINTGKVITGGLLAGLVFNILDMVVMGVLLAEEMQANAVRLGLDPAAMEGTAGMATWVVIDFLFGILVVWTYALIRPRLGPGPKTAIVAGLVLYLAVTLIMAGMTQGGMMTWPVFVKMSALSIVTTIAGSVVGAWAYTER